MRYVAVLTVLMVIIAGSALAEGDPGGDCCTCSSENCESVCQCEGECTCDGTVEGCTGDCCTCAADCDSVCDCQGECTCQGQETAEVPEETTGCRGCTGGCH